MQIVTSHHVCSQMPATSSTYFKTLCSALALTISNESVYNIYSNDTFYFVTRTNLPIPTSLSCPVHDTRGAVFSLVFFSLRYRSLEGISLRSAAVWPQYHKYPRLRP